MSVLRSPLVQKPYLLFHYYFLSERRPGNSLADLLFETSPKQTIKVFVSRRWQKREVAHYSFLALMIFFVYIIFPANLALKTLILAAFVSCFLVPLTLQFFVHALPIFTWLALFFLAGKIPTAWKPAILVKLLPAMETILYGDNLSNVLAEINTTMLDVLAWLPYGIIHFSAPFVVAAFIFVFAPPTSLRAYGFAFGYMNLLGVMTQILFPAAPPWYKNSHGLEPANYLMNGSPGGLGRIDALLGVDMYTSTFSNSPVVFGAFPSLHLGCSVMDVLFLCWLFPKWRAVWWGYACWLWWSTMYLTHHYFIDLIGGAIFLLVVFGYTKYAHLPVINHKLWCRWLYTQIERIDVWNLDPLLKYSTVPQDLELGEALSPTPNGDYSYFYKKSLNQLPNDVEMSALGPFKSRLLSRSGTQTHMEVPTGTRLRSTSLLNLSSRPPTTAEEDEDTVKDAETFLQLSMEHSTVPSVFETDHFAREQRGGSSNASTTLLDEVDDHTINNKSK